MSRVILFHFTWLCSLFRWDWKMPIISHWNVLAFYDQWKNNVRFEYVPWKNVCFCFIPMVWVHFSHRIKKSRFWKSLKYFKYVLIKKRCHIWIYPMGKCLILFHFHFWVHFSHKIEKFRFWKSLKYYVLIKKDMLSDLNISHGKMSEFVHFHCLGSP